MLVPTIVTFTGLAPSVLLYGTAVEHTQLLGRFVDEIHCCEVTFRTKVKRRRDGDPLLVQVHVALLNRGTRTMYGIAPNAESGKASLVLRQMLLALAQRIDDQGPCHRRTAKQPTPCLPVP